MRETRCRELALSGAGSGLSLITFVWCFLSEAGLLVPLSRVCDLWEFCAGLFVRKYITVVFRVVLVLLSCVFCG